MAVSHLEVLVEERSAEEALRRLLPAIVGDGVTFRLHAYQGKQDLLRNLPRTLRAYRHAFPPGGCIVVAVDRDGQACTELKAKLEEAAANASLVTRTMAGGASCQVLNRVLIWELESWFFGDAEALRLAYPRLPSTLAAKSRYRIPDEITVPSEELARLLRRHKYFCGGLPKVAVARAVAEHMDPDRNRSKSFQVFRDSLRELVGAG